MAARRREARAPHVMRLRQAFDAPSEAGVDDENQSRADEAFSPRTLTI